MIRKFIKGKIEMKGKSKNSSFGWVGLREDAHGHYNNVTPSGFDFRSFCFL